MYALCLVSLGIPSAPRHLRKLDFNQTTVSLSWSQPRHLGGRNDLFYEIECKIVCREDELSCSQDCGTQVLFLPRQGNFSQTKATVTNLFPRTGYIFKIYAKNGVSAVAEKDGYSSKFATSEVTTLESGIAISLIRSHCTSDLHTRNFRFSNSFPFPCLYLCCVTTIPLPLFLLSYVYVFTKIITICLYLSHLQITFSSFPFPSFFLLLNLTFVYILAPEKPEVTIRRIDSTSVIVSWTLNNGNEGIHYYLVTYRKLSDGSDEHTINTTQTKIEITGLEPGVEYEFEVSVQSVV